MVPKLTKSVRLVAAAGSAAALGLGTAVAASGASAAPVRTTSARVDDATAVGTDRFAFTGAWQTCKGCETTALGGSFRHTSKVGATATLRFTGVQAALVGFTQPSGGSAIVYVDGRRAGTVNFAKGKKRAAATLFRTRTLKAGAHVVTLKVVKGKKAGRVAVDGAVVVRPAQGVGPAQTPRPGQPAQPGRPASTTSTVSITFDDGRADAFTNARPLLAGAGAKATFYVISRNIGASGFLSADQLRQLAGEGHELGNHTMNHLPLAGQSASAVEAEFKGANQAIQAAAGVAPRTCSYPNGVSDATVRSVAAKYFSGCRTTAGGINTVGTASRYELKVFNVGRTTTPAMISGALASAKKTPGTWLIFVYHRVGTGSDAGDVTTEAFGQQLQAITASGVPVRTVASVLG